jgi:hypothetical protein
MHTLSEVAAEISRRPMGVFLRGKQGLRPVDRGVAKFDTDSNWSDLTVFMSISMAILTEPRRQPSDRLDGLDNQDAPTERRLQQSEGPARLNAAEPDPFVAPAFPALLDSCEGNNSS